MRKRRRKHQTLAGLRRDVLIAAAIISTAALVALTVVGAVVLH
jgi:hypothetical protein